MKDSQITNSNCVCFEIFMEKKQKKRMPHQIFLKKIDGKQKVLFSIVLVFIDVLAIVRLFLQACIAHCAQAQVFCKFVLLIIFF